MDFQGVNTKNEKFQGGQGKFDWKSRGESTSKKSIFPTGVQFFYGKAQYIKRSSPNGRFLSFVCDDKEYFDKKK